MLYTVSEACEVHIYASLVMCPRMVIVDIIIVYNLEVPAWLCLKFTGCPLSVTGTLNLTFLVRSARTPVASITQTP